MPDWTKSMQQTYAYYEVDPHTWSNKRLIDSITSCSIDWDESTDTLGSAKVESTEELDECYIRPYLVTTQNNIVDRTPLGTFLCQTPGTSYDGKSKSTSIDAYTPLIELKEKPPPIGYSITQGANILETAYRIVRENVRAPVVAPSGSLTIPSYFVSELDDNWFTFLYDFIRNAGYNFGLDELGRILFVPDQDFNSLNPVWTYSDDNSSILQPTINIDRDLYGIPNVLEVVYSDNNGGNIIFSRIVNDDKNSPISTVNRGREIVSRIQNPEFVFDGEPNQTYLDDYARQQLRNLSTLEYKLKYTHGYCPVRVGDCVLLDYNRAGLRNVRAKVVSQSIKCETGCMVEETAVYSTKLWG